MPGLGSRRHGTRGLTAAAVAAVTGMLALPAAAPAGDHGQLTPGHALAARPVPAVTRLVNTREQLPSPLPTSQCLSSFGIHCYTPLQYRQAYGLNALYTQGVTGRGRTIVVVDSFGSPTIGSDVRAFDRQFGFPDPSLRVFQAGRIPPFNPHDATMLAWAGETTLDVEYAHAVAPGAAIVLVETPVAETEGVAGFPEMMNAEQTLIDHGTGDVISQSFGATENTFPGFARHDFSSLLSLRYAFMDAFAHRVTVLAASGDFGATAAETDGQTLYPRPVNSWPSSDPLVTSVGGAQMKLDDTGSRTQPDAVWNDGFGAGGGGPSAVFSRPAFQDGVSDIAGDRRATPDISMSAAVDGGCWVYQSFDPSGAGWDILGGTSEATPMFAGIVALADQLAGHRLGDINPALYLLGQFSRIPRFPVRAGISDITSGNISFAGVAGAAAGGGYDLASGWGTVGSAQFVRALAQF